MTLRAAVRRNKPGTFLILALGLIPVLFPMLWMVTASFKGIGEIFEFPPQVLPDSWDWSSFQEVFRVQPFARQFLNSTYIALVNVVGTLAFSSLAGYAFARSKFPGRNAVFILMLSGLLMPFEVMAVPLFTLFRNLGWLGTHIPLLVLPVLGVDSVIGTFLMRQQFLSTPDELEDAGRIDGLGTFGIFWHVALPLARPALATVAILTFLASWNMFLEPLLFVSGVPEMTTVPVAIPLYIDTYGFPNWGVQMAASTISILPVVAMFMFAQRYIVQGFARVGIRG